MTERYSMYDPALRGSVLQVLHKWGRLPLSDLMQLLSPVDRLRFRDDVIEDLLWQGMIRAEQLGDERVLSMLPAGEQWIQSQDTAASPQSTSREAQ